MPRRIINSIADTFNERDFLISGARGLVRNVTRPVDDPQKSYMWEIAVIDNAGGSRPLDTLMFYARNVQVPEVSAAPIESTYMDVSIKHSGKKSSDNTIEIGFWDDENIQSYRYMLDWFYKTNNPYDGRGVKKINYKRDMIISMLTSTDLKVTAQFVLRNAFPTNISQIDLDYESSSAMEFSTTLTFDEMRAGDYA